MVIDNRSSNDSFNGNHNKTVGSILPLATSFHNSQILKSDYLKSDEWKDLCNKAGWYFGTLELHKAYMNTGFPAQITNTISDIILGVNASVNVKDKTIITTTTLNKLERNLSIFGKSFLMVNIKGDEIEPVVIAPLNVLRYEKDKIFEYYYNYDKVAGTAILLNRSIIEGTLVEVISKVEVQGQNYKVLNIISESTLSNYKGLLVEEIKNNDLAESDYENVRQLFLEQSFYKTYQMEEVRVAKMKVLLDQSFQKKDPQTGAFITDLDISVFTFGRFSDEGSKVAEYIQGDIRSEKYIELVNQTKSDILQQIGISSEVVAPLRNRKTEMTATEVEYSIARTSTLINRKKQYIILGIKSLLEQLPDMIKKDEDFQFIFNKQPLSTYRLEMETLKTKNEMGAISTEQKVKVANPGLGEDELMEEVVKIKIENNAVLTKEEETFAMSNGLI